MKNMLKNMKKCGGQKKCGHWKMSMNSFVHMENQFIHNLNEYRSTKSCSFFLNLKVAKMTIYVEINEIYICKT